MEILHSVLVRITPTVVESCKIYRVEVSPPLWLGGSALPYFLPFLFSFHVLRYRLATRGEQVGYTLQ
jgi:hypothetical protein